MSSRRFQNVLPLEVFIRRGQVKSAYRQLFRATRTCADLDLQREIQQHIRDGFRRNLHVSESHLIKPLIKEALTHIQMVKDLCGASVKQHVEVSDRESWLEEKDEVDTRGRVGEGWPWESSISSNDSRRSS